MLSYLSKISMHYFAIKEKNQSFNVLVGATPLS